MVAEPLEEPARDLERLGRLQREHFGPPELEWTIELAPGESKKIRGKLYVVPSDVDALVKRYQKNDSIEPRGLTKRDIVSNINFFMNVPVEPDGTLAIVDGVSKPGDYVEIQAEMDILCVISNCPQVNNPCNGFNPSPVRTLIWDA